MCLLTGTAKTVRHNILLNQQRQPQFQPWQRIHVILVPGRHTKRTVTASSTIAGNDVTYMIQDNIFQAICTQYIHVHIPRVKNIISLP